eukprot:CCRYP_016811-RA/>CCRYP_016811-RA protein AED:0.26 eAED:0.25 QI:0/0/0/1/0.5/0.66/3/0/445
MFCPKVTSTRGYKMAQIFASDFRWSRCYLITRKSKAHEALGLLFAWEGVPPKMIVDGAKEMKMGEFAWKCKEAHCYLQSTEPYSPWSNSAKREIRELKKGAAQKMMRSGAPQWLWCFALEFKSYVQSHTAHDIYRLDGHVPEMVVSGETADISPFCEFGFWDWVKFRDQGVASLGDALVLGKYLGPILCRKRDADAEELAANVIAEAIYAQCDSNGNQCVLLDAIVDYRKDPSMAVAGDDQVLIVDELCCEWKDGSTSWQKVLDLKESYPLQVAEFTFPAQIADEPAFNWWVSGVLKKRDRIISLLKCHSSRYHKHTHKYWIEIPKTVEEAYVINKATGTTFWHDAIEKEMKNVRVVFDILVDGAAPPWVHQFIHCHMIFDVKMEDFWHKTRLVAGGHTTKAPPTPTYASVVSRETIRIAQLVTALNDVDIWAADVLNVYITAPC